VTAPAVGAPAGPIPAPGTVYLVGAGPGDPGLLTVRAAQVLAMADVVVHDRLAEPSLLDLAPQGSERIDVGKSPGQSVDQEGLNRLLVERAREGQTVVRLKGGDPFVFGRGGEEALALAAAGIDWEVVPGISSALAAPAYAGVPVTHRGLSTSFTVVTGHSRHAVDRETNWAALAAAGGTVIVLMGVAHRAVIAARLMAGGLAPTTPVMAVRWGTRPEQTTVRTTLDSLGETALEPPVAIVIGAVAGLDLAWFERRPLFGRRVVVTRARADASPLAERLRILGAEVIELPTIAVADPADGGAGLQRGADDLTAGHYQWVVFTSPRAVLRFLPLLRDARSFGETAVAAIGPGTAAALAAHFVVADLVPTEFVAESLLAAFPSGTGAVLIPRAAVARDVLPEGLAAKGWTVDVVEAYRTVVARPDPAALAAAAAADAITFTSSSTVTNYLEVAAGATIPQFVACIGPVTAATARAAGIDVAVVAGEHSIDGLVTALVSGLGAVPSSAHGLS
jgi:uroporphyrinogen III methyltransferase/synthase